MILISGIPSEQPVCLAIEAAEAQGIPYVVFNQRYAHSYELSLQVIDNVFAGCIQIDGADYKLEEFNGAYVRMMDHQMLPEIASTKFSGLSEVEKSKNEWIHLQFIQWCNLTGIRIFNQPRAMLSNLSKPFQSQLITPGGFYTPSTCITNELEVVKQFKAEKRSIIYKSISSMRSVVKELEGPALDQLGKVQYLPTQFQEKLNGQNIRVHVVGDVLFATAIISKTVDYRYAKRENATTELEETNLPESIAMKCFHLAKALNLPFCGIDLFHTDTDEYFCFEVNPSPGYSYYQSGTGQQIAEALVRWLEFGTAKLH